MATVDECRQALNTFADQMADDPKKIKKLKGFNRGLACNITDLDDTAFHGRFEGGKLIDITDGDNDDAEIRMIVKSDDLVALVAGELNFMKAFTSGQVKVKANMMDMMKLKTVL